MEPPRTVNVVRIVQEKGVSKGDWKSVFLSATEKENKCFRSSKERQ